MLTVIKDLKGETLKIRLEGTVDERSDFHLLIAERPQHLMIVCPQIERINSAGVKAWIHFFHELAGSGTELTLVECSHAIVEQINLIVNFSCGAQVKSIFIPLICPKCNHSFNELRSVESLKKSRFELSAPTCPQCQTTSELDELEEEYFAFLGCK